MHIHAFDPFGNKIAQIVEIDINVNIYTNVYENKYMYIYDMVLTYR